ncbi:hypothetical protein SAZ11_49335 [Streptomyces sp. FXJ1.4098]|nr:hypothetical protein [Streptomyces sp. FXJ1.4098]
MAERMGQMIVDRCGWTDVTVQWVAHDQARLVPHSRSWWIGITVGISVQMWADQTLDDGTYGDPSARSQQLWTADHDAVFAAARHLREQVEQPGKVVPEWRTAVDRAEEITARAQPVPGSWDYRAVRGILAVTPAGLAHRERVPVRAVTSASLLEHLHRGPSTVCALADELGLSSSSGTGPAADEWTWLIRPWPSEPPAANGDNQTRGIGRGLTDPAVLVCTDWAALAVQTAEQPLDGPEA